MKSLFKRTLILGLIVLAARHGQMASRAPQMRRAPPIILPTCAGQSPPLKEAPRDNQSHRPPPRAGVD
jgi:hypothetical protein